jgi:hypothetical protein
MDSEADRLKREAEKCRRLARELRFEEFSSIALEMAEEFDRRAAAAPPARWRMN